MGFEHFLHLLPLDFRSFRVQPLIEYFFVTQTQDFPLPSLEVASIKRWDQVEHLLFFRLWLVGVKACLLHPDPMLFVLELRDIGGFCWMF